MTYRVQGEETLKFDDSVIIAESDVEWNVDYVGWITDEMAPKLDSLAEHEGP